jgi:glycosyltransferase involved in cell wall biosynthesis
VSGGERSLLDVLGALPGTVTPAVACPQGPLADEVRRRGLVVFGVPGTDASLRLHPAHTAGALLDIVEAVAATKRLATRFGADLVHANSIRAGVVASVARALGGPPPVVYVRDCLPPGAVSAASLAIMGRGAAAVLPNSRYTAATLGLDFPAPVRVVHSPLDVHKFDRAGIDRGSARARLGLAEDALYLTQVAQLTPWKAQDDSIRVLARVRRRHPDARLLLVGSAKFLSKATRYDNNAYRAWLGKLAMALDVEPYVHFLGERDDIARIFAASDVALLPSWEEPFGRSLIEASAMECPVIATNVGGPPEILADGEEGVLLPPKRPDLWAAAVDELLSDEERRKAMAEAARRRVARQFTVSRHVEAILDVYTEVVDGRSSPEMASAAAATRKGAAGTR